MRVKLAIFLFLKLALAIDWPWNNDPQATQQTTNPTPRIVSLSKKIKVDDLIGEYIEYTEGENISLLCNTPDLQPVAYHLPNLTEYRDYNVTDYERRLTFGRSHYNKTLFIADAKPADTGRYGCSFYKDPNLSHYIYLFIRSADVNETFIPTNARIHLVNENTAVVPCITNQKVDKNKMKLWVSQEEWSEGAVYDPRTGFQITITDESIFHQRLWIYCSYEHYTFPSNLLLYSVYREWAHFNNREFFNESYEVTWHKIGKWHHAGEGLSMVCNMQRDGINDDVRLRCPRCKNVTFKNFTNLLRLIADIEETTMEDAGIYECQILNNGTLYKQATIELQLSPTKGQIEVQYISPQNIAINEGSGYRIQFNFTHYPFILGGYNTSWTREYTGTTTKGYSSTNKGLMNAVEAINLATRGEVNRSLAYEQLNFVGLKTNQTGIYVLTIQIFDLVERIEFNITVQSRRPTVKMVLPTPTNYTFLGQKYYLSGSRVGIFCIVESVPKAQDIILSYRQALGTWQQVPADSLEFSYGTYETLVHWDTIVKQGQEVQCKARKGKYETWYHDTLNIGVADGKPTARSQLIRGPTAIDGENEKEIYEGDDLELSCVHPKNTDWHVVWTHNEQEIPLEDVNITSDGVSRILKISLSNVSAANSEVYTCVLSNSKEKTPLVLAVPFTVLKTQKPTLLSTQIEYDVKLQYNQQAAISCPFTGVPPPKIEWFKDGQPYVLGNSDDNGTLIIPRVTIEDKGIFTCKARNRVGQAEVSFTAKVIGSPYNTNLLFIIGGGLLLTVLVAALLLVGYMYCKQKKTSQSRLLAIGQLYSQLTNQLPTNPRNLPKSGLKIPLDQRLAEIAYDRKYELEKEDLVIEEILGKGNFGQVYKGTLIREDEGDNNPKPVAIKQPLNGLDPEHQGMLIQELKIMGAVDNHPNVLALLGAVTKYMKNGELYIIVEYCDNGNLKDYITFRKNKFINELSSQELNEDGTPKITKYVNEGPARLPHPFASDPFSISTSNLLCFALQIAKGMNYLANIPCVHRDLALRNVLVTANGVLRIADFGLARNIHREYYRMQRKKNKKILLPVRWMSIEAIEDGLYTVSSDIWSFGIVLYELFSLAGLPYPSFGNEDLLEKLKNGYRNPKPRYCNEEIFQFMGQCCEEDPKRRPNFTRCVEVMKEHLRRCNPTMLEKLDAKTRCEAEFQKGLVRWVRKEDNIYPPSYFTPVEMPQLPKRNSSFFKSVGNFFGGLKKKSTPPSAELVQLAEIQPPSDPHSSNRSLPVEEIQQSAPSTEIPPIQSRRNSYLLVEASLAAESHPLIGSQPPSESYLPIGLYPASEPESPL